MQSPLRHITSTAKTLSTVIAPFVVPPSGDQASVEIPLLQLVSPPDIWPCFEDLSLSEDVVREISRVIDKAAAATRQLCVEKYRESCERLLATHCPTGCSPLPDLFNKIRTTLQEAYERNLRSWANELLPRVIPCMARAMQCSTSVTPTPLGISKSRKAAFNHVRSSIQHATIPTNVRSNRNVFPSWKIILDSIPFHLTRTRLFCRKRLV